MQLRWHRHGEQKKERNPSEHLQCEDEKQESVCTAHPSEIIRKMSLASLSKEAREGISLQKLPNTRKQHLT